MTYFWVFLGGGLGSIVRYGIAKLLSNHTFHFPWPTFIANMLACLVLGVLVTMNAKGLLKPNLQFLLMTGFCGGFSTFSTFSFESLVLLQDGNYGSAFAYIVGSCLFGIVGVYLGMRLGGAF